MAEFTIMSYNIKDMNLMFRNNVIKPSEQQRAQKIAAVIQNINPHVLGICEAANSPAEHGHFINNYLPNSGYQLAHGTSRGGQNLVFYYRPPFSVISVDDALSFYAPWEDDIEQDGLKERHKWERKPLEAVFEIGQGGPQFRIILVHAKSKGIFSVVDLYNFQKISLANRKRLVGQALKLRERLDDLLQGQNPLPIVVMGDMNDGPGLDPFEMMVGKSFVETVMGSVYDPGGIFHNSLWWMSRNSASRRDLWTVDFPDPIVENRYQHRVWIDHILLSPDTLLANSNIRYVMDSGSIGVKNRDSREASDHFAVYCKIED
jgi:hypothetical protein